MPKIIKNGKEYSGVPIEVVTAWAPTADPVQVKEPLMGNTDISNIGDGTVTGAITNLNTVINLGAVSIAGGASTDLMVTDANYPNVKAVFPFFSTYTSAAQGSIIFTVARASSGWVIHVKNSGTSTMNDSIGAILFH